MIWVEEEENSDQSNKRQNIREILHTWIHRYDRTWNVAGSGEVKKNIESKKKRMNLETMEGDYPKGYSRCKKMFAQA